MLQHDRKPRLEPPRLRDVAAIAEVLIEEGQHRFVPDARVLRLQDPVVLVREVEEPGGHPVAPEVRPQAERLADRDAEILFAVDHQHWRANRPDVLAG